MRVGIDFHGTVNAYPEYFAQVMRELRGHGHRVGIVTGAPEWSRAKILERMTELGLPRPDFLIMKSGVEQAIPNVTWKHLVMRREGIDLMFDDLDTGVVRLIERSE